MIGRSCIFPYHHLKWNLVIVWLHLFVLSIRLQVFSGALILARATSANVDQWREIQDSTSLSSTSLSSTRNFYNQYQQQKDLNCQSNEGMEEEEEEIHVIILVHGWMGNSNELRYLEQSLTKRVKDYVVQKTIKWRIHSATSNNGRTFDGVAAGGHRLANEVNDLLNEVSRINTNQNNNDNNNIKRLPTRITLSLVGNSLGGLYTRYALSEIDFTPNGVTVFPNVFCTLATPHLGVSRNTYLPLPRFLESGIATAMMRTGEDMFLLNNVLQEMITHTKFIQPLRKFHHRRAYANAYNTDFQVPFRTAAFLSETNSVHYDRRNAIPVQQEFISLIAETPQVLPLTNNVFCFNGSVPISDTHSVCTDHDMNNVESGTKLTMDEMAVRLDELGWTKVFCDMRQALLRVPNPISTSFWASIVGTKTTTTPSNTGTSSRTFPEQGFSVNNMKDQILSDNDEPPQRYYTSAQLLKHYGTNSGNTNEQGWWYVPLGHTVLVANSKTEWSALFNSAGRPLVDHIADDIVRNILHIKESEDAPIQ